MSHVLEIDGVQLQFNGRTILSDIYLRCETGTISGLLGRNGQGKSCLMKIMHGSLLCEKSLRVDQRSIAEGYRRPEILRYLPQFTFIPPSLSLRRVFADFEVDHNLFQNRFPEFAGKEKLAVGKFSAGERRLTELYLIAKSPSQFALLDEPFTHLSPLQVEKAKAFLVEEKSYKGFLITDHRYRHVTDVCDNLYVLSNGKTHLIKDIGEVESLGYARMGDSI